MTDAATSVKLHTIKAKIESLLFSPDSKRRSYKAIPYIEEMLEVLDGAQTPNDETLVKAAGYYKFLGSCYEKLPFYPHAIRCYSRAFAKLNRATEEFGKKENPEELSMLYYRIAYLRNCTVKDLSKPEPDLCPEQTPLMKKLIGEESCREILKRALKDSERAPRVCPAGYTPQFINCLYEVEGEADRKISQLDPALVSESSLDNAKIKLFAEKGITWYPPRA